MRKMLRYAFMGFAVLWILSCAGTPKSEFQGAEALNVTLSNETEIKSAYGYTYATNPFLPYPGLFSSGMNSFLVVRFQTSSPLDLEITGVDLLSTGGKLKTRILGKEELRLFWETRSVDDDRQITDANNQRRFAAIDRYALRLNKVNTLRRNSPYSLVILAPLEEDIGTADLVVRYVVNGEYRESTFTITYNED